MDPTGLFIGLSIGSRRWVEAGLGHITGIRGLSTLTYICMYTAQCQILPTTFCLEEDELSSP